MKKITTLLDFIGYSVNDKLAFYKYSAIQLADALVFPMLPVPLATINLIIDDFEQAVLAAKDGARSLNSEMHDKEKIADDLFRTLALYVNKVADGDVTIILKSGFHASHQPIPFEKQAIALTHAEHSGSVNVVMKAVVGAVVYRVKFRIKVATGAVNAWVEAEITTVAHCLIDNLTPGSTYEFVFASVTSSGTSDYSEPLSIIVV